jgi:hypothetical protein
MALSRIGIDGELRKDSPGEGFGLCSTKAHKAVLNLLVTIRTEADPSLISDKILKAFIYKHGDSMLKDDESEGRALGLQSGDESGEDC